MEYENIFTAKLTIIFGIRVLRGRKNNVNGVSQGQLGAGDPGGEG